MSGHVAHDKATRTTTLSWGPWRKPLSIDDEQLLARLIERTTSLGYATLKAETAQAVTITATLTAPRTQPFPCVREAVTATEV